MTEHLHSAPLNSVPLLSAPLISAPLLSVRGLTVRAGDATLVSDVSFDLEPGETVGIVGSSGSGKSMTLSAVMGLPPDGARVSGSVRFHGRELIGADDRTLGRVRGERIAWVLQDPMLSLTPTMTIGAQIAEAITIHHRLRRSAATARAVELLDRVGIADAATRVRAYPHEFSGGMRQRVAIAMAVANEPDLLLADEPTSALDVTVAGAVLDLFEDLHAETGMAVLLVSHDDAVVDRLCTRVLAMDSGALTPREVPPTIAVPDVASRPLERSAEPVLVVDDLVYRYPRVSSFRRHSAPVLDRVSLSVGAGEAVAVVGESGSGKSTLLRCIAAMTPPSHGRITMFGSDYGTLDRAARAALRARVSMVFQDPSDSLNPRMTVADVIAEPLRIRRIDGAADTVRRLLDAVELPADVGARYPRTLSGGQQQRVAIARALALEPNLLLLDEPVSSLDSALRGEVMDLLHRLRVERGLTYLLVAHDLTLVQRYVDRVVVMAHGRVVESGAAHEIFVSPTHPQTRALVHAMAPRTRVQEHR